MAADEPSAARHKDAARGVRAAAGLAVHRKRSCSCASLSLLDRMCFSIKPQNWPVYNPCYERKAG